MLLCPLVRFRQAPDQDVIDFGVFAILGLHSAAYAAFVKLRDGSQVTAFAYAPCRAHPVSVFTFEASLCVALRLFSGCTFGCKGSDGSVRFTESGQSIFVYESVARVTMIEARACCGDCPF